jgi:hypothetical protein
MNFKRLVIALIIVLFFTKSYSQSIGFSYFFPKNGYFSNPIAPVNLSLPISFGNFFQISPGISLISIGGMNLDGLPDELRSTSPLIGPFQSLTGSLVPTIVIPTKNFQVDIMGGLFGFASLNTRLMSGNFNNMLSEAYNYQAIGSDISIDKSIFGWGYLFGAKLNFRIQDNIWGYIGARYYIGSQGMTLNGNYIAARADGSLVNNSIDYPDASLLYHGFEIIVGGALKKKKK